MTPLLLALKVFLFGFMSTTRTSKTAHSYKTALCFDLHCHIYIYDFNSLDSAGNV